MELIIFSILNPLLALGVGCLAGWVLGILISNNRNKDYEIKDLYFKKKVRDFIKGGD